MKITFLGANHEVTGSRTLLEWREGRYALIDCGMEQGQNEYENAEMPVPASAIEYVLITHAHVDHTGELPRLYREGFRGTVYLTRETANLCAIMLADSAHIQMQEAEYESRKAQRAGLPPVEPPYDLEDVNNLTHLFRPCEYGEEVRVDEGLTVRFTDVGHLMGSAAIECWLNDGETKKKIVFSGDIGNLNQPILNDPRLIEKADYVLIESTYGDRVHEGRVDPTPMLTDVIQRTLDRGGNLIIPSFAVGRTQEMLYLIRDIKTRGLVKGHDGFPVYVDSPLANEATAVFLQCDVSCLDEEARAVMAQGVNPISFEGLETVVTSDESKALNTNKTPKVIISASGMCDAGRVRHHLKYNLWREDSTVLFVGYQSAGTLGRQLQDGAKTVKLFGDEIAVHCEVETLQGVSGHADREGLLRWLGGFHPTPGQIFINHGDHDQATAFAQTLRERFEGARIDVPYSGSAYDLAEGKWIYEAPPRPVSKQKQKDARQADALRDLVAAANKLVAAVRGCQHMTARRLKKLTGKINDLIKEIKT